MLNLRRKISSVLLLMAAVHGRADDFQGSTHLMPFDEDTIAYSKTPDSNAVTRLQDRIARGEVKLRHDDLYGYLLSVMKELDIPRSSQMLVFSKTSFQRERISPRTPRALYYNQNAYIGFIPEAPLMEVSVADPRLGAVFYTLDQKITERPRFIRSDNCLECHASAKSMGVPGHLLRSFATDESGVVDLNSGILLVNHRTPFPERWGGWYVTGLHGDQTHRGNLIGKAAFDRQSEYPNYLGNITNLGGFFDIAAYPMPHSDIVALMVLEHQTHMHNFITRLNYSATLALKQYGHIKYMRSEIEAFLRYLLFTEEAPLSARIKGTSDFAKEFQSKGPRDQEGRSLRELDLQTRLFKYPCSYLIYSDAFDNLPGVLKDRIYERLLEILSNRDSTPDFQNIPSETRQAILQILRDTKPDFNTAAHRDA